MRALKNQKKILKYKAADNLVCQSSPFTFFEIASLVVRNYVHQVSWLVSFLRVLWHHRWSHCKVRMSDFSSSVLLYSGSHVYMACPLLIEHSLSPGKSLTPGHALNADLSYLIIPWLEEGLFCSYYWAWWPEMGEWSHDKLFVRQAGKTESACKLDMNVNVHI